MLLTVYSQWRAIWLTCLQSLNSSTSTTALSWLTRLMASAYSVSRVVVFAITSVLQTRLTLSWVHSLRVWLQSVVSSLLIGILSTICATLAVPTSSRLLTLQLLQLLLSRLCTSSSRSQSASRLCGMLQTTL